MSQRLFSLKLNFEDLFVMKLIFLLIYTPFVCTELHHFTTTYTGVKGIKGIPEFFAVTTLDGQQVDYYDSITQTLNPKQKWLEMSQEMLQADTEARKAVQLIYKNNIDVLMLRFNQSGGIYIYQRMYGCTWDSETDESNGFDMHGYNGDDFITLDLKEAKYVTSLPQAVRTMMKWNENKAQIEFLLNFYKFECTYWLKHFLNLREAALKITAPEVSLLEKSESLVSCHVTGFYPAEVRIYWLKNEQKHDKDVEITDILPNEDGTFQRTVMLSVGPEEWHKNQYVCVVEHKSLMKKILKILYDDEIKSNDRIDKSHHAMLSMIIIITILVFFFLERLCCKFRRVPCPETKDVYFDKQL